MEINIHEVPPRVYCKIRHAYAVTSSLNDEPVTEDDIQLAYEGLLMFFTDSQILKLKPRELLSYAIRGISMLYSVDDDEYY